MKMGQFYLDDLQAMIDRAYSVGHKPVRFILPVDDWVAFRDYVCTRHPRQFWTAQTVRERAAAMAGDTEAFGLPVACDTHATKPQLVVERDK